MKIKDLKEKKILILGLGKEGTNTYIFLRKTFPKKVLGLADQLPFQKLNPKIRKLIGGDKKIKLFLGKNYLEAAKNYEVVIKTPGISPFIPKIRKIKTKLTSQTEIFFNNCPGGIIGVTGTKGKSTAASVIYKVLKEGGLDARLTGNIGRPSLLLLEKAKKETIYVYELSSHQIWNFKKSPHIAVFLNIFPEHGDYYPTFGDYIRAKKNITLHQNSSDYFIYNSSLPLLEKIATETQAQKMSFSIKPRKNSVCFLKKDFLIWRSDSKEEKIIEDKEVPLLGNFNLQNVMPGIIIGKIFKIPSKKITQAIKDFKPLKHRLEYLGKYRGIIFYDDSISTVPETTIAALKALGNKVETIFLGGHERKQNFTNLAQKILKSQVKNLILFPPTGKRIWREILKQKSKKAILPKHFFIKNMRKAVSLGYQHTQKEKICLLSPASSSFGLFRDYRERGNLFKKYIKKLA